MLVHQEGWLEVWELGWLEISMYELGLIELDS